MPSRPSAPALPLLPRLLRSKTARELLLAAAARNGRYAVEACSGRGTKGGRVRHGNREAAALNFLLDAGLVEITHREHSCEVNHGYSVHYSIRAFQILPSAQPYILHLSPQKPAL